MQEDLVAYGAPPTRRVNVIFAFHLECKTRAAEGGATPRQWSCWNTK